MRSQGYSLYDNRDQQRTYRGLVAQVVDLYGIPCLYLPKTTSDTEPDAFSTSPFGDDDSSYEKSNTSMSHIYGEDIAISYKDTIHMKCMLENIDGFDGQHNMFSKFGFTMEDQVTLFVEIETWRNLMSRYGYDMQKPKEGDLISFEMSKAKNGRPKLFEIKNVNENTNFFSFGELMVFSINCSVWEYSHEKLETGDTNIDSLNDISTEEIVQKIGDNNEITEKSSTITKFHPNDPFGDEFED